MAQAERVGVTVRRVIDWGMVDAVMPSGKAEYVRIIGLNTPKTFDPRMAVQRCGKEASARAYELKPVGSAVTPKENPTRDWRDRNGRYPRIQPIAAADPPLLLRIVLVLYLLYTCSFPFRSPPAH